MISTTFDTLARSIDGTLNDEQYGDRTFRGVSIDSRTINSGELFIAVRGAVQDGHQFIPQAIEKGAAGLLTESTHEVLDRIEEPVPVVGVADTHEALIALARTYRDEVAARRIAITGSNGKTTTKEFTYHLLETVEQHVYRSPGNFNNLYGLPLAILRMPRTTELAVFELGVSIKGEMARLAKILEPEVVLITNVGPSHLEFLGTVEGVASEKLALLETGTQAPKLIINADNHVLVEQVERRNLKAVTFAIDHDARYRPRDITHDDSGACVVTLDNNKFRLPLFGRHHIYNLLAAYSIVRELGYDFDGVQTERIELSTAPMRGEVLTIHGVTIISDCYNANPDSVRSGLISLSEYKSDRRIYIVLGDMLELGEHAAEYHRQIGQLLADLPFEQTLTVGPLSQEIVTGARKAGIAENRIRHFETADDCATALIGQLRPGDLLYVKGSRGIGLERIIERWQQEGEGR